MATNHKLTIYSLALLAVLYSSFRGILLAQPTDKAFDYQKDFKDILQKTNNPDDSLYAYKMLLPRFLRADTTLTNRQVLAMQIYFTQHTDYMPYHDMVLERLIWNFNEQGLYEKALTECDTLLAKNPFNLVANKEKAFILKKMNTISGKEDAAPYLARFQMLVRADTCTGNGLSYGGAWFVLSPIDGQVIIDYVYNQNTCVMTSGEDRFGNFHDILGVKQNKTPEPCVWHYFNIQHAYVKMFNKNSEKLFKELEEEMKAKLKYLPYIKKNK